MGLPEVWDTRGGADSCSRVHYEELALLYHLCQDFNLACQLFRTVKFLLPHSRQWEAENKRNEQTIKHWAKGSKNTHT